MMVEKITAQFVRDLLPTRKHRLDDELEVHADVLERISAEVARRNTDSLAAKDEFSRVEARVYVDLHKEAARNGVKITVDQANSGVKLSRERNAAMKDWQAARELHEEWQGLYEAWRTKGFNIARLTELHGAQYFAINSGTAAREPERQERTRGSIRAAVGDYSKEVRNEPLTSVGEISPRPRKRIV